MGLLRHTLCRSIGMGVQLESVAEGRTLQMSGRTFAKLLALARLEGWKPERLPENWATNSSADTEVVLQELNAYGEGIVSETDARGLSEALSRVAKNGGAALGGELLFTIMEFCRLLGNSSFIMLNVNSGDTAFFTR